RAARVVSGAFLYAFSAMRFELGEWAQQLLGHPDLADDAVIWQVRGVRAWAAWSTGDIAGAVAAHDDAAAHDLDPAFWFHNLAAYVQQGDEQRTLERGRALRNDPATDQRQAYFAALVQPFDLARTADHADQALAWADRSLAIATAAGYPSGI